jgi:hypothetical protein
MVKYNTSIDAIKKNGRGVLILRSIGNPKWETMTEERGNYWTDRQLEDMCCASLLLRWCSGNNVTCVHGKVGCLLINTISLWLNTIIAAHTIRNARFVPNS